MPKTQTAVSLDLKEQVANFKKWRESVTGESEEWQEGRQERLAWYRSHLTAEHIGKFSEDEFAILIKSLWAVNIWHNKDYNGPKTYRR